LFFFLAFRIAAMEAFDIAFERASLDALCASVARYILALYAFLFFSLAALSAATATFVSLPDGLDASAIVFEIAFSDAVRTDRARFTRALYALRRFFLASRTRATAAFWAFVPD